MGIDRTSSIACFIECFNDLEINLDVSRSDWDVFNKSQVKRARNKQAYMKRLKREVRGICLPKQETELHIHNYIRNYMLYCYYIDG